MNIASSDNTRNPCAKPRGIKNWRLFSSDNSTIAYLPSVGESSRKSTATSSTFPFNTRTSLACEYSPL